MEDIIGYLFHAGSAGDSGKKDDDFTVRLSTRYSVSLLVCFAVLIGVNGYVRDPLNCWTPAHFHDSHTTYTNNYCWVKNTYYVPFDADLPRPGDNDRNHIIYYQWMPIILLLQATFFYLPTMVWHMLNQKGGIDADDILSKACSMAKSESEEQRSGDLKLVVAQMHRFLKSRSGVTLSNGVRNAASSSMCSIMGRRMGCYLTSLFVITKVFFIVNAIGQIFVLSKVLGVDYSNYGYQMTTHMVADHDWTEQNVVAFPRVTFCDIDVRRLGNLQRYTLQCVLPINMYNEKIYTFLWFWIVFVAGASSFSLLIWVARILSPGDRRHFVKNHLTSFDRQDYIDGRSAAQMFTDDYLMQDGALLLRLIAHNTNNVVTTDVVRALYLKWLTSLKHAPLPAPPADASSSDGDNLSLIKHA